MPPFKTLYTLTRHSAWTVAKKPGFKHAVESQMFHNEKLAKRIKLAGGFVTDHYQTISDLEYSENYPDPDDKGIYPQAKGTFHTGIKVQGHHLYIPPKKGA